MTTLTRPAPAAPESPTTPLPRRLGRLVAATIGLAARRLVGMVLCFHHLGALLVVGWTFRLMRRRILAGWWRRSPAHDSVPLDEFLAQQGPDVPAGGLPRWVVGERSLARLRRPGPAGDPPGLLRRAARVPAALVAGLWANFRAGLGALACTYLLTGTAGLLMLGAWEYGWNVSFDKIYEQAFIGFTIGFIGVVLFILAMLYVPMAWAHLAATGDPRAFFQFGFVTRLIRQRRVALALYAGLFSLLTLPATALWCVVMFLPNIAPDLLDAPPEEIQRVANYYIFYSGIYVFAAFVAVHLLAGRIYRGAVLRALARDPRLVEDLHPALHRALSTLELLPTAPARKRHVLVAVVLGTGRRGTNAALWLASFLLWFTVAAQLFLDQFFRYHPFLVWLNGPLIHLPSLHFVPGGLG